MVFFTLGTLAVCFVVGFQCIPIQAIWDRRIQAQCLSDPALTKVNQGWGGSYAVTAFIPAITYVRSVITVIMDTLCVLLPVLVFGKIQISWRSKVAVFTLLGLGLL